MDNKAHWNEITPYHVASAYYDVAGFLAGRELLHDIELQTLGDVRGLRLLHLQCHFGLETLAWARHGARVTGVDFSEESIHQAKHLAVQAGLDAAAEFVEANVLDLDLGATFDIIYTSRGALNWLPDLTRWAASIQRHLAPGGRVLVHEMHPFALTFEESAGQLRPSRSYFHVEEPWIEDNADYAEPSYVPEMPAAEWNWPLQDVVTALMEERLTIRKFCEHDFVSWPLWPSLVRRADREWTLPTFHARLPLSYTILASR